MMFIILVIVFIVTKNICEKELKIKLYLKINKKDDDGEPLNEIIHKREKEIFKEFLIEEKQYNKESIEYIVNHYRTYIKQSIVEDNFWAIIGIVISIVLAFVTKEGFDFNSFEKSFMPTVHDILDKSKNINNSYYLSIINKMYNHGYFKKGIEELTDEHANRNYDKSIRWIENGIIPEWLIQDIKEYEMRLKQPNKLIQNR